MESYSQWDRLIEDCKSGEAENSGTSARKVRLGTSLVLTETGKAGCLEVGLGVPWGDEPVRARLAAADVAVEREVDGR